MAQFPANIDLSSLDGTTGFRLSGGALGDESGYSVASAGDVNGDGYADLIIGAPGADPHGDTSGASYVVFGQAAGFPADFDLSTLNGVNGFRLAGAAADNRAGISVASAGDVNGDGFTDVIVGADSTFTNNPNSGASYVVFGRASGFAASIDLSTLDGTTGFKLLGVAADDGSGNSVASAGDVNGDGFDDVIIGAAVADPHGSNSGASYVVFGKATGFAANVDLSTLNGATGFKLSGVAAGDFSGVWVASAGDINGDGFADLIIGALGADPHGSNSGASYVVFGKAAGFAANIDLSTLDGTSGFKLSGVTSGDRSGGSVASAGDVNGDGYADLIIGASASDPLGGRPGASYVVFGKASGFTANLDLSTLDGTTGFTLNGEAAGDGSGNRVASAGDVNGDGFDDVIIGAPAADPHGSDSGASYVVFGKAGGFAASINLSTLDGTSGFKLSGVTSGDLSGQGIAGAGDVNRDGFADLIIGAALADPNGNGSGASYLVFGRLPDTAVNRTGTGAAQTLAGGDFADTLSGLGGNDTLYGHGGIDTLDGGAGDDILIGGAGADNLTGGADNDTASYFSSGAGVTVNLTVVGPQTSAGDASGDILSSIENLAGSGFADVLTGDGNANTLTGGAGDTLNGGAGDDVIVVDGSAAAIDGGADNDTVRITASAALTSVSNVEQFQIVTAGITADLSGVAGPVNVLVTTIGGAQVIGSSGNDSISGGDGDDTLTGGGGADNLTGGLGNNTASYLTSSAGVTVDLTVMGAQTSAGDASGDVLSGIENLTGSGFADALTGDGGANTLTGGAGDTLNGGAGDDVIVVDGSAAAIDGGANNDTVRITASAALTSVSDVEQFQIVTAGITADLSGVAGPVNVLVTTIGGAQVIGSSGNDTMTSGTGIDTLDGGAGDDTYFVNNTGDVITENSGEGTDTVNAASVTYALSTNVENLVLMSGAFNGTGNALVNTITGNSNVNTLDGGAGADFLIGGAGNDTYVVDNIGDVVTENPGEGTDTVNAGVTFTLSANVENLTLTGAGDIGGTGNSLANSLTGNTGNNVLDGVGGVDTMFGGAGNDAYYVDDSFDRIVENVGEGLDAVYTTASYALRPNVEDLFLQGSGDFQAIGNDLVNTIVGNSGNNYIDGGAGADVLTGGAGNDAFIFQAGEANGDSIMDFAGNGAAAGDALYFIGFGAGAALQQINATVWQIDYNGGASHEQFTLANGASIHASDFVFV